MSSRIDVEELLRRIRISDVVSRRTKLRRSGRLLKGLCPFHNERTPSFYVYDATDSYYCYGCCAGGDAVDFVMQTDGLSFRAACEALANGDLPEVSQVEKAKAREEDKAERAAAIEHARVIWDAAGPLEGSPARVYLRTRGIEIMPERMRFAECYAWINRETGELGPDLPALVCAITDVEDVLVGIQRIFLQPDGSGKSTRLKVAKLSLGRPAGGAIRLGPASGDHVIVVEGPEDGATVAQMRPDQPVFVGCGTGMLPQIKFPAAVRKVTIGGDNNKSGRMAAQRTKAEYQDRGLEVRAVYPDPDYLDWNDQLCGKRRK